MHVVISNVYGDDNRGGAALTAAAIMAARASFPDARITLVTFTDRPSDLSFTHRHTRAAFPDVELKPALLPTTGTAGVARAVLLSLLLVVFPRAAARFHRAGRFVAGADIVIGKGGQMFRTRGRQGLVALWLAMFPLLLASRMGKPTVVYGQAFGPFRDDAGRRLAAGLLRRLTLVLLRDPHSIALAAQSGLESPRVREIPDTVFGLDWPSAASTRSMCREVGVSGSSFLVITVTVRMAEPALRSRTLEPLAQVVRGLLDRRVVDQVLVVLQVDGKTSDANGTREFIRLCNDSRVRLLDRDLPWESLAALYGGARCVIGGRVHSNILGILGGTVAFPIDYTADKAADIFGSFGMADKVIRLDRQIPDVLIDRIADDLALGRPPYDEVHAVRTKLQSMSREAYSSIATLVDR